MDKKQQKPRRPYAKQRTSRSANRPYAKQRTSRSANRPYVKSKQAAAWICIIALAALYIATFLTAILDTPGSGAVFRTCLGATVVLPVLLWMYLWLYSRIRERDKNNNNHDNDNNDSCGS